MAVTTNLVVAIWQCWRTICWRFLWCWIDLYMTFLGTIKNTVDLIFLVGSFHMFEDCSCSSHFQISVILRSVLIIMSSSYSKDIQYIQWIDGVNRQRCLFSFKLQILCRKIFLTILDNDVKNLCTIVFARRVTVGAEVTATLQWWRLHYCDDDDSIIQRLICELRHLQVSKRY